MFRSTAPESTTAGFTLIEVLVALSIVAVSLSSIGALIATTVRGTRSIESHFTRLETAQAILTALPDREQLAPGNFSGEVGDYRWRINVSPFTTNVGTRQQRSGCRTGIADSCVSSAMSSSHSDSSGSAPTLLPLSSSHRAA